MFQRFRDKQFGEKYSWEVIANKRNGLNNLSVRCYPFVLSAYDLTYDMLHIQKKWYKIDKKLGQNSLGYTLDTWTWLHCFKREV